MRDALQPTGPPDPRIKGVLVPAVHVLIRLSCTTWMPATSMPLIRGRGHDAPGMIHMSNEPETFDRLTIRELIESWAMWRDAGMWERLRTVWHDDGRMR